ncbi:Hypothetical protein SRAE_X000229200 [Strongyloides ratti]|uniref:DUF148 domain-containing protein n=1 Tax=Strongyloides ratti TaxID=34506 RepID=A0A090KT22_STRRB|nr:Hypothetical protein SRAE_X000229200 [Strongyloides ratti]CEF60556.1 Hypothetical protein SRAE_X000229200 [Strongyloides ratti]
MKFIVLFTIPILILSLPSEHRYSTNNLEEIKYNIEQILSNSKYLTPNQVDRKIENLINSSGDVNRRDELLIWYKNLKDKKAHRKELLKTTIMNMSQEARTFIFRIILIQQNERLSPIEKEIRLRKVSDLMSNEVRNEIAQNLLSHDHLQKFLPLNQS